MSGSARVAPSCAAKLLPPPTTTTTTITATAVVNKRRTARHNKSRLSAVSLEKLTAFKFPVGAMLSLQLYRKLRRKSILEDASSFFPTGWTARRSLDLDAADREYEISGGVHFVRVELYRRLLAGLEPNPATDAYVAALLAALKLNVGPARSREEFVADSSAQLDALREMRPQLTGASSTLFKGRVVSLRTADALLRPSAKPSPPRY